MIGIASLLCEPIIDTTNLLDWVFHQMNWIGTNDDTYENTFSKL